MFEEFIVTLNKSGKVYKVYHYNEGFAITRLKKVFKEFSNSNNKKYEKYWLELIKELEDGFYTITKNYNFKGVVEVLD